MLRASGKYDAALQLELAEFSAALESIRTSGDTTPVAPLLAVEANRVAEAVLLAELLAPLLASRLNAAQGAAAIPGSRRGHPVRRDTAPAGSPAPTVADFIDGMLAQDRTAFPPG